MQSIPQFERGRVWCTVCGTSKKVNAAASMQFGWPKCCGYTMTIDSPDEREARRVALTNGHGETP